LVIASFKGPRNGFPSPDIEALAKRWHGDAEARGHDLIQWKVNKSDPGWITKCVKCDKKFVIRSTPRGRTWTLDEDPRLKLFFVSDAPSINGLIEKDDWVSGAHVCQPTPRAIARGMRIEVPNLAELRDKPSALGAAIWKVITRQGLGASWTSPDNRTTLRAYAGGSHAPEGNQLPIILSGVIRRDDQRRNYIPAQFMVLPEYEEERELYLNKHEVVRVQLIEWCKYWDDGSWESVKVDLKAKT
jgi:hypothetical protein